MSCYCRASLVALYYFQSVPCTTLYRQPALGILQDADSLDPKSGQKKEGAFYVWEKAEIDEVLGADSAQAKLFKEFYTVKPEGNATMSPRR